MIGLDFPLNPQWIYAVHALWQPRQPVNDLIQLALSQTMQELGGEKTRRNSLTIILRYFVGTEGGGNSRTTLAQDVWVAYSRAYPPDVMAPAYLAHLIAQSDVAQVVTEFIHRRYNPGDDISSSDVRRYVITRFGERKVVTNAASAFLRTLQHFGVLGEGARVGQYRYLGQLAVQREVFPLLVWSWWQRYLEPQIDLQAFAASPAFAFLHTESLDAHWRVYQSTLWVLEERIEGQRATLKYTDAAALEGAVMRVMTAGAGSQNSAVVEVNDETDMAD